MTKHNIPLVMLAGYGLASIIIDIRSTLWGDGYHYPPPVGCKGKGIA